MFKRFLCCFTVCLLGLLLLSGCGGGGRAVPDQLPLMIMAEDTVYQHGIGVLDASVRIDDGQVLGHITTVIENEIPARNGEANFPAGQDAPYARCPLDEYPDSFVVFFAHQWYIFLPLDD